MIITGSNISAKLPTFCGVGLLSFPDPVLFIVLAVNELLKLFAILYADDTLIYSQSSTVEDSANNVERL